MMSLRKKLQIHCKKRRLIICKRRTPVGIRSRTCWRLLTRYSCAMHSLKHLRVPGLIFRARSVRSGTPVALFSPNKHAGGIGSVVSSRRTLADPFIIPIGLCSAGGRRGDACCCAVRYQSGAPFSCRRGQWSARTPARLRKRTIMGRRRASVFAGRRVGCRSFCR